MDRKDSKPEPDKQRKATGIKVDQDLLRKFRALALLKGKTAADLLEEVMRDFLKKYESLMRDLDETSRKEGSE